jgi:hypothetical protein
MTGYSATPLRLSENEDYESATEFQGLTLSTVAG